MLRQLPPCPDPHCQPCLAKRLMIQQGANVELLSTTSLQKQDENKPTERCGDDAYWEIFRGDDGARNDVDPNQEQRTEQRADGHQPPMLGAN